MAISLEEFMNRAAAATELFLMVCTEVIVYDPVAKLVYIPISTHNSAHLNPMGDFKTHIGHGLLWSQHVEIDCTSQDLSRALAGARFGSEEFVISPYQTNDTWQIYTMEKRAIAATA